MNAVDVRAAVRTENRHADLHRLVTSLAARLVSKPEVAGVFILGGLAANGCRRFADEVSDLDLCVVLDLPEIPPEVLAARGSAFSERVQPYLPRWLPNFKFRVPSSVWPRSRRVDIDVHQLILQYEAQPFVRWDLGKLEAYSATAELVYDERGQVAAFLARKLEEHRHLLSDRLIEIVASVPVRLGVDVDRCLARGLCAHAHHVLGAAWQDVVTGLFLAAGHFPPNSKWALLSLASLGPRWAGLRRPLEEALLVRDFSVGEVRRRAELLKAIWRELNALCRRTPGFPDDPYTIASTRLFLDRQLRHVTAADERVEPVTEQYQKMSLEAWNRANWDLEG